MLVNFGEYGALSLMLSSFFKNKFEKIQNNLTNEDINLEVEVQNQEAKLVIFTYPFLGESTLKVQLVGDFNYWDVNTPINMTLDREWNFVVKLWLPTNTSYQYRFLINGNRWENAANACQYVTSPFGSENMVLAI